MPQIILKNCNSEKNDYTAQHGTAQKKSNAKKHVVTQLKKEQVGVTKAPVP